MVKLTEDMIVARTRVSDLTHVKKLNCWGAELTDISVIRKLTNVEVLSLSVNSINTLSDIQYCNNLQELYIRKNKIPEINEICWLKDLTRLRNLWLEENPFAEGSSEMYRLTVIKALPQLQKLDNVPVQSEEMADAMRRGLDLLHPLDSEGEGVTYNLQDRPPVVQHREEPQEERRSSRGSYYEEETTQRRESVVSQVQSPSRRVSNQVFENDRVYTQHSPPQPPPVRRTSYQPAEEDVRRMSIREEASHAEDRQDRQNANNNYQEQVQQHRSSYSGPTSSDGYRGPHSTPEAGGFMTRAASQEQFRSPYRSPTEVGVAGAPGCTTPEGRGVGAAARVSPEGRGVGAVGRLSPPDLTTLKEESGRVSKVRNSSPSSVAETAPAAAPAPQEGQQQGDVHAIVSQHYDTTYRQVHQQLESAHQLVAQRASSPQRPYPARPKNRNSNVLSAILCLIKEIDGPSLEVVEMAVRCRMEELED